MGNKAGTQYTSGFTWYSTAEQVLGNTNLTGKNILITGANTGIGKESARVLVRNGANVIIGCRSLERGQEAVDSIKSETPDAKLTLLQLDLGSLKSVKAFAEKFNKLDIPLHVLLNNAGIMAIPTYTETEDGIESQFGTNHVGHFYLTHLLLPRLREGSPSRIVNVSSEAHRMCKIDFNDLSGKNTWYEKLFGRWFAYSISKTSNILFSVELTRRLKEEGANITVNALHPGAIKTDLQRSMPSFESFLMNLVDRIGLSKTIPQGAATSVYLATHPNVEGLSGLYCSDSNVAKAEAYATDPENAKKLWQATLDLLSSRNISID
eukprot:TRINITY_DN14803_c0_g1_i1.p1 TRINITY_DN14803_c0_g1~~TRINITY_DN14803_c0_g1_i1.p1  ORF type:complete len:322 (-),score=56.73 TRINITY_DN14803_c0_g1_i1:85-1050(-)